MIPCRRWLAPAAAWLLLMLLCGWLALDTATRTLAAKLEEALPARIAGAGINRLGHENLTAYLVTRIEEDLARLPSPSPFSLVDHCRAQVLRFQDQAAPAPAAGMLARRIDLSWQSGGQPVALSVGVDCQLRWPSLLLLPLLPVLAAVTVVKLVPGPLSSRRQQWIGLLVRQGVSRHRARSLSEPVDRYSEQQQQIAGRLLAAGMAPEQAIKQVAGPPFASLDRQQLPWLYLALERGSDADAALAVARAKDEIVLDSAHFTVCCHGVPIKLSATPFIYYYWYARRRADDVEYGWFTNPPANRADQSTADELVALMETLGGHGKAVADLRAKGLRARNLDQNRSKVKEELVRVLGEPLASGYLFDMERDPRTARHRYRLALDPARIRFA